MKSVASCSVGALVGATVGVAVNGAAVGATLGECVGSVVGTDVGAEVGIEVGTDVGAEVGTDVGVADVGIEVGTDVGVEEGDDDGAEVGDVGASVGTESTKHIPPLNVFPAAQSLATSGHISYELSSACRQQQMRWRGVFKGERLQASSPPEEWYQHVWSSGFQYGAAVETWLNSAHVSALSALATEAKEAASLTLACLAILHELPKRKLLHAEVQSACGDAIVHPVSIATLRLDSSRPSSILDEYTGLHGVGGARNEILSARQKKIIVKGTDLTVPLSE